MPPETRYARAGDVSIAYQVFGDGPVELVTLGGPAGNIEVAWELPRVARYLERLASFARVAFFDRRGTGMSDPMAGPPTLEQYMEDLAAVADAAGFGRHAISGGSDAGRVALLYAATHPDRVSALVLNGTSPAGAAVIRPEIRAAMLDVVERSWGTGDMIEFFAPSLGGDPIVRRWMGRYERASASPGVARRLVDLSASSDVRAILPAVRIPVLVIHRRDDRLVPLALAQELADALPDGRLVVLEGTDNAIWAGDTDEAVDHEEEFLTGMRRAREPERVLATVLFTDVVDSTRRAAELGDREWRARLSEHDRTVRESLARWDGREVKSVGDGFVATFAGPARGVRCAQEAIQALGALGLPSRAGLHTGEVEVVGDDIAGLGVHIAARVTAAAEAGEVLVSRTVRDLVVGSGLRFADRGEHALRGVPDTWRLFSVER